MKQCPKCEETTRQMKAGFNRCGTQRMKCGNCNVKYTVNPKKYTDEVKQMAIKMYYSGVSGRGVGKILGMSKSNVMNWIKKTEKSSQENMDKSEN